MIQQRSAGALASVSLQAPEAQSAAGKAQGLQPIVEGARAHLLQGEALHFGIAALLSLTWSHEESATALITKLEAMPFIVERASYFFVDSS